MISLEAKLKKNIHREGMETGNGEEEAGGSNSSKAVSIVHLKHAP